MDNASVARTSREVFARPRVLARIARDETRCPVAYHSLWYDAKNMPSAKFDSQDELCVFTRHGDCRVRHEFDTDLCYVEGVMMLILRGDLDAPDLRRHVSWDLYPRPSSYLVDDIRRIGRATLTSLA